MSQEKEGPFDFSCNDDQSVIDQKKMLAYRKRGDSDMDTLLIRIREKETEQDSIKNVQLPLISKELKELKAEKNATIEKRKQIDTDLDKLNKDLPEKMRQLSQLESSLIYKSEDKINTAIQKLDWTLQHQHFKLTEERKIVTEIDRLKRSKRTLAQFSTLKQEISGIRDKQRRMREERDMYFRSVSKMKGREEALKQKSYGLKSNLDMLKGEIGGLYEQKWQLRKQKEDFQGMKERQRRDVWKRRDESRKSFIADIQKEEDEPEVPYEKQIQLCNTLFNHLQRYANLPAPEPSVDSLSPSSSLEVEEDAEDGHHILRKKSSDTECTDYISGKKVVKKTKKPRKQSSFKKMTHPSQVLEQFLVLGLSAPSSLVEIPDVMEKLKQKKAALEKEQHPTEVASDAGLSATESYICEMSRQASKTESYDDCIDTHPGEHVYAELIGESGSPEVTEGAVGGCEGTSESSDVLSPNSDSTLEGDSGESQTSSVIKSEDIVVDMSQKLAITEADRCNNNTDAFRVHNKHTKIYIKPDVVSRRNSPPKNLDCRPKLRRSNNITDEQFKPATLLLSPSFCPTVVALAAPSDIKDFKPKKPVGRVASSPASVTEPSNFHKNTQHGTFADQLKSPSVSPSSSFAAHQRSHPPLTSRLSTPVYGSSSQRSARRSLTIPSSQSTAEHHFDMSDFPPLSQVPLQPKSRSNSFFSKSSNDSPVSETVLQSEMSGLLGTPDLPKTEPAEAGSAGSLLSHSISVSEIPAVDKLSTEKWVESNAAYFHPESSVICKET